ncbi:MAG: hypothetical protein ACI9JN_000002 [Bacteroidia bacterium]|jgi:hypothetical protein
MNRLYNLALLIVFSFSLSAQTMDSTVSWSGPNDYLFDNSKKLVLSSDAGLVSSFLINSLIFQDFWTDDIIQNQSNALSSSNRLGGFINTGATFYSGKKQGLYFGINHNAITGLSSQKDVVKMVLRGNHDFPSLSLDQNNKFESQRYSALTIGLSEFDSSSKTKMSFGFSLLFGHQYAMIEGSSGLFVTDSSGEEITVTGADLVIQEDLSNFFGTIGAGFNFQVVQQRPNSDVWSFQVSDFGFIQSSNIKTSTLLKDFTFDGFDVSSQINSSGGLKIKDSVDQNYLDIDTSSGTRLAPFQTAFRFIKSLGNSNQLDTRISYLYFSGYYPLLESNYQQQIKGKKGSWRIGARLGGFGAYGINFGAVLPFSSRHLLMIDVTGLESMASNNLPVYWYGKLGLTFKL